MGRYELVRPSLRQRLITKFFGSKKSDNERDVRLRVKIQRTIFTGLGFLCAGGYLMVTVVDPYGGSLSSAYAYGFDSSEDAQTYGLASSQKISFSREGWKIVTGDEAAALYVADAAPPETGTIKDFAYSLVLANSWGKDQYSCLVALWQRESNWRWNAYNKDSGAYGIPQALPGVKMSQMGTDWQTNPETQIRWGINYIKNRYGAPCGAMAHSNKFRWY